MTEPIHLGELEQIVLLAVLRLKDDAYAIPILEQIEAQTGRRLARGALYTALDRLEAKGCLRSQVGEPLPERGGRARRYFTVTPAAVRALKHSRASLLRLWHGLESLLESSDADDASARGRTIDRAGARPRPRTRHGPWRSARGICQAVNASI